MIRCSYSVVFSDNARNMLVLRDLNDGMSITNDVDNLVLHLRNTGQIHSETVLYYYDSEGRLDQILHDGRKFCGFTPGSLYRNKNT